MYMTVRLIIGVLLGVGLFFAIKKSTLKRKPVWYGVMAGVLMLAVTVSGFFPLENLFLTFQSPQAAYRYYSSSPSEVDLVVEGTACDLVVDRKQKSDTLLIVPKELDRWKLGLGSDTKKIAWTFEDGISVDLYQYKDTSDYFVVVMDTHGGKAEVFVNDTVRFYLLEDKNSLTNDTYVEYFAHVPYIESTFNITVNGHTIQIDIP